MTRVFPSPKALFDSVGEHLGPTDWLVIDQARVNGFADITGDHQWIHVDPERAAKGPFGGTIAHGYLSLSLVNFFLPQLVEVQGMAHGVNVGADRLRFLNPVKVGSRLRAVGEIVSVEAIKGAVQYVIRVTLEIEGADKPALVVDTISRAFGE